MLQPSKFSPNAEELPTTASWSPAVTPLHHLIIHQDFPVLLSRTHTDPPCLPHHQHHVLLSMVTTPNQPITLQVLHAHSYQAITTHLPYLPLHTFCIYHHTNFLTSLHTLSFLSNPPRYSSAPIDGNLPRFAELPEPLTPGDALYAISASMHSTSDNNKPLSSHQ